MAKVSVWKGVRSFTGYSEYENIYFEGTELGSVRFTGEIDVQYRVFKLANDEGIIIQYIERDGYDCISEIFEYPNIEEAAAVYRFVLKKAGVI